MDRRTFFGLLAGVLVSVSDGNRVVRLNGKPFTAYDSAVDRLHIWDGTRVRRVGLAQPAAPRVEHTVDGRPVWGARQFKVAWTAHVNGITTRRSELSAAASYHGQALICQPTRPNEGETHWEIYESPTADGCFRLLATVPIQTSRYAASAVVVTS